MQAEGGEGEVVYGFVFIYSWVCHPIICICLVATALSFVRFSRPGICIYYIDTSIYIIRIYMHLYIDCIIKRVVAVGGGGGGDVVMSDEIHSPIHAVRCAYVHVDVCECDCVCVNGRHPGTCRATKFTAHNTRTHTHSHRLVIYKDETTTPRTKHISAAVCGGSA